MKNGGRLFKGLGCALTCVVASDCLFISAIDAQRDVQCAVCSVQQ